MAHPRDTANDEYTSPQGAGEILGLHLRTVRRRIADGTLPAYHIKGTRGTRIRVADVKALLEPIPTVDNGAA